MTNSLIGFSGYVGSTILKQEDFTVLYRSTNISEINNKCFETVVCAGAPAQKWIANQDPQADLENVNALISHLRTVTCKTFILISTVDVFKTPIGVDEDSPIDEAGLHAYGLHRRLLEKFVQEHFQHHLILRLPGLVGPGLRKNVIFDFLNDNNTSAIDSRAVFQFYPMVNLWSDIKVALSAGLSLVHLTAEPISVKDLADDGFGKEFTNILERPPAAYDFQSKHALVFSGSGKYTYTRRETLLAVRTYAQSESRLTKVHTGECL